MMFKNILAVAFALSVATAAASPVPSKGRVVAPEFRQVRPTPTEPALEPSRTPAPIRKKREDHYYTQILDPRLPGIAPITTSTRPALGEPAPTPSPIRKKRGNDAMSDIRPLPTTTTTTRPLLRPTHAPIIRKKRGEDAFVDSGPLPNMPPTTTTTVPLLRPTPAPIIRK